jgi:tetratricopeptide (TPR) repeat protein
VSGALRGRLLLCLAATSCAGVLRGPPAAQPRSEAVLGWAALVEGDAGQAAGRFARALAHDPADARARFGAANLAREHGDAEAALAHSLALVAAASRGQDDVAVALAAATLSRVPRLLAEVADRRPAEERLIALDRRRLPWPARYALALVVIEIARRRADAALLDRAAAQTGCAPAVEYVGTGGRLPLLDLASDRFAAAERPRPLLAAGCQFQLNSDDGRMGIKVLRSELELTAGRHELVLDFAGPARMRLDDGPWQVHDGALDAHGARWSAMSVETAAGKHQVELRIGMYGGSAELALLALPAAPARPALSADGDADLAMLDLAAALEANLRGDSDAVASCTRRLAARSRFAVGLAAAGRLAAMDGTRPADVTRDEARELWQRALAEDAKMARVWLDLADLEMQRERPREAAAHAERACQLAPRFWPAQLARATALRSQGLERPADEALAAGLAPVANGQGGCQMLERALQRKQERGEMQAAGRLVKTLGRCDAQSPEPRTWAEERGDLDGALALLAKVLPTSAEPLWLHSEMADLRLARGEPQEAARELEIIVTHAPRDTRSLIRLADAQLASGRPEAARSTLASAMGRLPGRTDLRRAARLAGLPLALEDFRVDGAAVVREFLASGRSYQAPAVVVLDRAVERVFPDGTRLILTHTISQVLSKDAIDHVGEVQVPGGAEVLGLRTRKADGTLREAEEIAGKHTFSAPNLAVGDFVESETLETKEPREAFAPGFVGERFYFQSFDSPLDRSEYVFIAPAGMPLEVNARAGAPAVRESRGPDGTRVLTFQARAQAQVFAERSAVPAVEWLPSVRLSSGAGLAPWSRFVGERFARVARGSPAIRRVAADIARQAGGQRAQLPEAIATWVAEHIEPETDYTEPATVTLAHGRGNRAGLLVALARSLHVPVDLALARSRLFAEATAPLVPGELDDFRDVLVRFPVAGGDRFVDPRLRRAPFGYVPPGLDGAPAIVAGTGQRVPVASTVSDSRQVSLRAQLAADGSAHIAVTEEISGWPAVEWRELLDRAGKDRSKLRQGFEQHWLGHHFPGAQLEHLRVDGGADGSRTLVQYTFAVERFADRQGHELHLRPSFFRAQPGRRYGTEPERKTTLGLGPDVDLDLEAALVLPAAAKAVDVGQGGAVNAGGARFIEERRASSEGGVTTIRLRRLSRLPLLRVSPGDYPRVAALLRRVDPLEQGEIRITLPPESSEGGAGRTGEKE